VNFLLRLLPLVIMLNYCAICESHNVSKTLFGVPKEDELKKLIYLSYKINSTSLTLFFRYIHKSLIYNGKFMKMYLTMIPNN
jgi:hypothetical protein